MSGSSSITLHCTILDTWPFLTSLLHYPETWEKHLPAGTSEYWGKYRELLKSIMSSKFRTLTWQKFVLNACCIADSHWLGVYIYICSSICVMLLYYFIMFITQKNAPKCNNTANKFNCTTAMDFQHLKVKEKDICLTKNYCTTIGIQKINSFHKFIFKIQQILGSHELKGHGHF